MTEPQPRCGSDQIAGRGIAHTYKHVRMGIYTVPTHALMKIHIFKHTTLVSNRYLFSKKIEHCSGVSVFVSVCVCMGGLFVLKRIRGRFRFSLQRFQHVCVSLCSCETEAAINTGLSTL